MMYREEKKCKNPECDAIIQYFENPKKLFCDSTCKSRYHYLKDIGENAELIFRNKAIKTNYKIIVNFIEKGVFVVDAQVAKAIGFNRHVYMDLFKRFLGKKYIRGLKRIKDVFFVYNIENGCIYFCHENTLKDLQ